MDFQLAEKNFRLSLRAVLCCMLLFLGTALLAVFLYCRVFGKYTVRQATDVLFAGGWALFWIGLAVWFSRSWHLASATRFFKQFSAYESDRVYYTRRQRFLAMVFQVNGLAISVLLAGLSAIFLSILFGKLLAEVFPPHAVVRFLIRPDIWNKIKFSDPTVVP